MSSKERDQLIGHASVRLFLAALAVVLLGPGDAVSGQSTTLEPGTSIERSIKKDEIHTYRLPLSAGQCFQAEIKQNGVAVSVVIFGAQGSQLATSSGHHRGQRRIFFVAPVAGEYRLQVSVTPDNEEFGGYEMKIADLRVATDTDRSRYAAQELFAEAVRLGSYENAPVQTRRTMVEKYQEALQIWRKLADLKGETDALLAMGQVNYYLDRARAVENLDAALIAARAVSDRWCEELILENLGEAAGGMGETDRALEVLAQSLAIARELKDKRGEEVTLYALAQEHVGLGEAQAALDYNNQLLEVMRGDSNRVLPLHSLCKNYLLLGEPESALEYCRQASSIWRASGKHLFEAATLSYIGDAYSLLGEPRQELEYYDRALQIFREVSDAQGEASMQMHIGRVYQLQGDYQKALECLKQAEELFHSIPNFQQEAVSVCLTGQVYWSLGMNEKALGYFNRALAQQRTIKDHSSEAASLLGIARSESNLGQLIEARRDLEMALGIVETLGAKVTSLDLRASYLSTKREYYEVYIDLLMRLDAQQPGAGYAARAFQASERARARRFVELLGEAHIDIRQGVDPDLLARERTLQQQLNVKSDRLARLVSGPHDEREATAAEKGIEARLAEYQEVEARIRSSSPRYAALTQPVPLSLKEIQSEVLDENTVLLEYSLGADKSLLWTVTPNSIKSFELPGRATIEAAARRFYESLTARGKSLPNERPEQKQLRINRADAEYPGAGQALSRMVLGPAASELGKKRLLVVSDGALQYVPFAALPEPRDEGAQQRNLHPSSLIHPLVVDHEIVTLPSASVLATLRKELAGRKPATRTVAVLADPVFTVTDPRIPGASRGRAVPAQDHSLSADVLRSAEESGLTGFERLRFSRGEADAIARLVPEGQSLEAVDFVANRTTATSADLSQYRIIHFATHGLINSQHPALSGVVLSLMDEKGQPQDGFLRLYQIYNLKLNADLVVLSACQTALGKEIKGEGLIGLTRGFMYAGAPRVVASLWRIDDHATAELMKRFYREMLGRQKLSAAAALRAAQVEMWKEKGWENPYFWAFTLQGEWR